MKLSFQHAISAKISCENERKLKKFSSKYKLGDFISTRSVLQEMLKEIRQTDEFREMTPKGSSDLQE